MCLTEFNEKVFIEGIRAEGKVEGDVKRRANDSFLNHWPFFFYGFWFFTAPFYPQ